MDVADHFFDEFQEDLHDAECVQEIYDFCVTQVHGLVDDNDEDDIIQDVFYRLTRWPIQARYNSKRHYFSLLKITVRQSLAAYWRRRHSQRNDCTRRRYISELENMDRCRELAATTDSPVHLASMKEIGALVLAEVETLDERQKVLFQLRFLQDRSPGEIAQRLNISVRTVYRVEAKLRERLQGFIENLEP